MSQNLISLTVDPADIDAVNAAIDSIEAKLSRLIDLSVDERRTLVKMGDKSEAFCRQTMLVLGQNRQIIPANMDFARAEADLHTLDQLRPVFGRLRQLLSRVDDTEMALGSDILSAALEGYALARIAGKGAGLDTLREAMSSRLSRKHKAKDAPPAVG